MKRFLLLALALPALAADRLLLEAESFQQRGGFEFARGDWKLLDQIDNENKTIPVIADDETDFPIPGEDYTFSILKQAQALGDFRALSKRGRRVIGIVLNHEDTKTLTLNLCLRALVVKSS